MKSKSGFTQFSLAEFEKWITALQVRRTIRTVQQHHTWSPHYGMCKDENKFELCINMRHYHIDERGWADIGQHFTTFPDGCIITGRDIEKSPACIFGNNSGSICIEHVGNFDTGKDTMTDAHKKTIVGMTAALCKRFNLQPSNRSIVYHHWFNLSTGLRNDGAGTNKSCPGTAFFGGNSVASADANFIPLVSQAIKGSTGKPIKGLRFYAKVNTGTLNVRTGPSSKNKKSGEVHLGAIVRVYDEQDGWYKIAKSNDEWIYGRYADKVDFGIVTASFLNVRSGPGTQFPVVEKLPKGQEVVLLESVDGWSRISLADKWVSGEYVEVG